MKIPKRSEIKNVNWPIYGLNPQRTRYLPGKFLDPPFVSSKWSLPIGHLIEHGPVIAGDGPVHPRPRGDRLFRGQEHGQGQLEEGLRRAERRRPGLLTTGSSTRSSSTPTRSSRSGRRTARSSGASRSARRARESSPMIVRRQADLRLPVRLRLRAQPEDRSDPLGDRDGRRGQGRRGLQRRRRVRLQLRRRVLRDRRRQTASFKWSDADHRRRLRPGRRRLLDARRSHRAASTSAPSTVVSTRSTRTRERSPGRTRPEPRSIRAPCSPT